MSKIVAQFFSVVFHPALMPLIGVGAIFVFSPIYISEPLFLLVATYVFLGTYLFPFLLLLLLKRFGMVSSLQLGNAHERYLPYLTSAVFFFLTASSLREFPIPSFISTYLFSAVVILGICLAFLKRIKISMHMSGIGGLVALVVFLSQIYRIQILVIIAIVIVFAGILGTARLILRAHTPTEVYIGFCLGLVIVSLSLHLF